MPWVNNSVNSNWQHFDSGRKLIFNDQPVLHDYDALFSDVFFPPSVSYLYTFLLVHIPQYNSSTVWCSWRWKFRPQLTVRQYVTILFYISSQFYFLLSCLCFLLNMSMSLASHCCAHDCWGLCSLDSIFFLSSLLKRQNWPLGVSNYFSFSLSFCSLSILNRHEGKGWIFSLDCSAMNSHFSATRTNYHKTIYRTRLSSSLSSSVHEVTITDKCNILKPLHKNNNAFFCSS